MSEKYAVMPMSDYTDLCDTIKEKTGATSNHIKSGELPTKIGEVYEAGQKSEYDRFWDKYQYNGNPMGYTYAFAGARWMDDTYNPKYEIKVRTAANSCFYYNNTITDTKVPIDVMSEPVNQIDYMFRGCSNLKTIRLLKVQRSLAYTNVFLGCSKLENITFEGEIGTSISFADCPLLTPESMISVIDHLVNYAETDNDHAYTVTFTDACWNALEEYMGTQSGDTSMRDYVDIVLGWNT